MAIPSVDENLINHQREAEWLFAAAAFYHPERARVECGWLRPDQLQDLEVRKFWQGVQDGLEAPDAAIKAGILYKISDKSSVHTFSSTYLTTFARAISDDIYLVGMSGQIGELIRAVSGRDIEKVRQVVTAMDDAQPVNTTEIADAADAGLEFMSSLDDTDRTIKSGIRTFDQAVGGFERQTMAIIGARPSMGKTSLGLQLARAAVENGGKVIYFSLEMAKRILWARMACGLAHVPIRDYRARRLTDQQRQAVIDSTNQLIATYGRNLLIDDRAGLTTSDIWETVARYKPDLFVVDHLGLVREDEQNEVRALHNVAWAGKQIAKQFDAAAIFLYQLNRAVESQDNKRPTMANLRGSGRLEEDADIVLFLHRDDYYEQQTEPKKTSNTDLIVAKDRDGARNICVKLMYQLEEQKFYALADWAA